MFATAFTAPVPIVTAVRTWIIAAIYAVVTGYTTIWMITHIVYVIITCISIVGISITGVTIVGITITGISGICTDIVMRGFVIVCRTAAGAKTVIS